METRSSLVYQKYKSSGQRELLQQVGWPQLECSIQIIVAILDKDCEGPKEDAQVWFQE